MTGDVPAAAALAGADEAGPSAAWPVTALRPGQGAGYRHAAGRTG